MQIKRPGEELFSRPVDLVYDYDERQVGPREEAYARLLDSALDGDQRLFARADGVEEGLARGRPRPGAPFPRDQLPAGLMGPRRGRRPHRRRWRLALPRGSARWLTSGIRRSHTGTRPR